MSSFRKSFGGSCVKLTVPKAVAEDILGDLEEEFETIVQKTSYQRACRWYLKQSLKTSCHFIWHQRGDHLVFVFALTFFLLTTFIMLLLSADLGAFYDVATLITVTFPSIALGIATTNVSIAKKSIKLCLGSQKYYDYEEYIAAAHFLCNTGNIALMMGLLCMLTQWFGIAISMGDNDVDSAVITSKTLNLVANSFLAILYSLIIKVCCFTGEKRARFLANKKDYS